MEKHIHVIAKGKVENIIIPDGTTIDKMSILFKAFSDNTRLKILYALLDNSLNVCEISYLLGMTHSAISHQLASLKMMKLVKSERVGKEVYYSLADDHVRLIIAIGKEHIDE